MLYPWRTNGDMVNQITAQRIQGKGPRERRGQAGHQHGPTPMLLTVGEVAGRLSVHPNTIRRWSEEGLLNPIRLGPLGHRKFREAEIDRLLR